MSVDHMLLQTVFDPVWYLANYQDVAEAGMDPWTHFADHGFGEGRSPGAWFDGNWYLRQYPDAKQPLARPLHHYLEYGMGEGRYPNAHWLELDRRSRRISKGGPRDLFQLGRRLAAQQSAAHATLVNVSLALDGWLWIHLARSVEHGRVEQGR